MMITFVLLVFSSRALGSLAPTFDRSLLPCSITGRDEKCFIVPELDLT
jgi:hypothetical protein